MSKYTIPNDELVAAVFRLQMQLDGKCPFCWQKVRTDTGDTWEIVEEHLERKHVTPPTPEAEEEA